VLAAQQRADDAELQTQLISQQSEARSVGLESRLSELSETLGNVERLRQQDQQIIQKLRERLVQVYIQIITFAEEGGCMTGFVLLSRCLSADNSKRYKLILMKLCGRVHRSPMVALQGFFCQSWIRIQDSFPLGNSK